MVCGSCTVCQFVWESLKRICNFTSRPVYCFIHYQLSTCQWHFQYVLLWVFKMYSAFVMLFASLLRFISSQRKQKKQKQLNFSIDFTINLWKFHFIPNSRTFGAYVAWNLKTNSLTCAAFVAERWQKVPVYLTNNKISLSARARAFTSCRTHISRWWCVSFFFFCFLFVSSLFFHTIHKTNCLNCHQQIPISFSRFRIYWRVMGVWVCLWRVVILGEWVCWVTTFLAQYTAIVWLNSERHFKLNQCRKLIFISH